MVGGMEGKPSALLRGLGLAGFVAGIEAMQATARISVAPVRAFAGEIERGLRPLRGAAIAGRRRARERVAAPAGRRPTSRITAKSKSIIPSLFEMSPTLEPSGEDARAAPPPAPPAPAPRSSRPPM